MKTVNDFPPNWGLIETAFPKVKEWRAFFCYGDQIFNPFNSPIRKDNEVHEMAHSKSQASKPDEWWFKYISDPLFRYEEELFAYAMQFNFVKSLGDSKVTEALLNEIAEALSGDLYNFGISFNEARCKVRNKAKHFSSSKVSP
jgi:hypothetical protein